MGYLADVPILCARIRQRLFDFQSCHNTLFSPFRDSAARKWQRIIAGRLFDLSSEMTEPAITPELVAQHNLTPEEYAHAREILGRVPTYTELGIFSDRKSVV